MVYNLTSIENSTNLYEFANSMNTISNGGIASFFLFILFLLILIVLKNYETKAVLIVDSFVCWIVAILLWSISWIGWAILLMPTLMLLASLVFYFATE